MRGRSSFQRFLLRCAACIAPCTTLLAPPCAAQTDHDPPPQPAAPTPEQTPAPAPDQTPEPPTVIPGAQDFTFTGPDGHTYSGRIDHPSPDKRNGFAIVMLGGGIANDLDWSVPADYAINSAESRDGARISAALAARGFVVMRWETIPTDGDFRAQWPNTTVFNSYPETLDHARAALAAFRQLALVEPGHTILLGHSLGATRACQLAESDGPIAGLVLLSAAQMTRTGHDPGERQALGEAWIAPADSDADGRIGEEELQAARDADPARPLTDLTFADLDRDGDGRIVSWEAAAPLITRLRQANDGSIDFDKDWRKYTQSRPEDVLAKSGLPVLLIYGGLDEDHAVHGPILESRATAESWPDCQIRYFPAIGHQLGPEQPRNADQLPLFGPMSDEVLNAIGEWLEARFHR